MGLNSPELNSRVSFFSDRLLSVVRPSVCPSLNFSHIYLKNYSTNFNQTCHTALLGHRESSLVKWKATPITRMGKSEIANEVLKKTSFFETSLADFNQIWPKSSLIKRNSFFYTNEDLFCVFLINVLVLS